MKLKLIPSAEGNVTKLVFQKADAVLETVLYRYPDYQTRTVICCSTQSGCPVGCRFCGAGDHFVRNATTEEIVAQIETALDQTGVDPHTIDRLQIMFMSMGEPLLNFGALKRACEYLYEAYPHAALLISTIGPKVNLEPVFQLAEAIPTVGLQFSVHYPDNRRRNQLIPFEAKMDLLEISVAGAEFHRRTGRRPFFNYCAGPDNSGVEEARQLADRFNPAIWEATVSVICERNEGLPARNDFQERLARDFSQHLLRLGFNVRVFDPAGQDDIGGGCGQLWFVQDWMRRNPDKLRASRGNGLPTVHTPVMEA